MRKNFVDNLRWLTVLWLVPYHAADIFRPIAHYDFYVTSFKGGGPVYELLWMLSAPWMMPLLFMLAGVSACYALDKRTPGEFARERVYRLLIPLILVMIFLSPVQTYLGALNHGKLPYGQDSFWDGLKLFLTGDHFAAGYTGGFSVNGFWFVRHLFMINVIAFPAMVWFKRRGKDMEKFIGGISLFAVACLFIFPAEAYLYERSDYGIFEHMAYFAFGFFVFSNEEIQEKLRRRRWWLVLAALVLTVPNLYLRFVVRRAGGMVFWCLYRLLRMVCLMAIMGLGRQYLNGRCKVTDYLTRSSYGFYLLHQTILIVIAHYVFAYYKRTYAFTASETRMYFVIVGLTFAATFLCYEILHRIPGVRLMLGTKVKKKQKKDPEQENT